MAGNVPLSKKNKKTCSKATALGSKWPRTIKVSPDKSGSPLRSDGRGQFTGG